MKFIYLLFVSFLVIYNISAQNQLTLQEAVQIGLEKNYNVRITKKQQEVIQNNNTLGNAGFLPTLDVNAARTYSVTNVNQSFISGTTNERKGAKADNLSFGASLNWTIFDGMGMFIAREQLQELETSGKYSVKMAMENTIADISSAYINIIQQKQRLNSLQNALKISEQRVQLAKDNYEVGKGGKAEYLNAQIDYNTDKSAVVRQKQALANAGVSLNEAMGQDASTLYETTDSLIIIDETLELAALSQKLLSRNSALTQIKLNKNIAYFQLKQTKSQRYPRIDLFVDYNYIKQNSQAGILATNQSRGFTYGARATMNIFNGSNQRRQEANAKIEVMVQEERIEQLQNQLTADLTRAYQNYENSLILVILEKENLSITQQSVAIALERYKQGVSTPLELREVQRNTVATETRLIDALYNAKIAEIELQRLSGQLIQDDME